jgi:large subunit ribosomal protein L10
MSIVRPEKVAVVDEVKAKLSGSDAAIITEYRGMTVSALADLRISLRGVGAEYRVYKNTLARRAAREAGDVAATAKALKEFSKTNPLLVIRGGVVANKAISAKDVEVLADLPPREVLLAQFAGLLQAPLVRTAGLLQALPRNTAYGLKALIDQKEAA